MTHNNASSEQTVSIDAAAPGCATAVILAAGEGTRMKSKHAKVVHEVLGKPMVSWVVDAARAAGCGRLVVVVGSHAEEVRECLRDVDGVECVEQTERLGTGHAVRVACEAARVTSGPVLVLCGDTPLLRSETLAELVRVAADVPGGALLTMTREDPTGYGRVTTDADGMAVAIVEQKDCTPEQAACTTCNAGVYCFDAESLAAHICELGCQNAQGEYYLTDMVAILREAGTPMRAIECTDASELMGVNSRVQLAQATRVMQGRLNESLMASGVTMLDPSQVWVGPDVTIGRDTTILPGCILMGQTSIGEDCVIGPCSRLTDVRVGNRCVVDETVATGAWLEDDVNCGPRAYLRKGTHLLDGSKAGTHVEIKNSTIGRGSKVPHLSYVGDATVGENVNLGAGTITCNYDGKFKHPTTIGDNTFVGSSTMLVAPVNVGSDCTVGAGSVITKDVPDGALALERSPQRTIDGWLPRWKRESPDEHASE